eukprot:SAG11_NODE_1277_length_5322_cov_23.019529_1_plen_147_part_10
MEPNEPLPPGDRHTFAPQAGVGGALRPAPTVRFELAADSPPLPAGIRLDSRSGVLSGEPSEETAAPQLYKVKVVITTPPPAEQVEELWLRVEIEVRRPWAWSSWLLPLVLVLAVVAVAAFNGGGDGGGCGDGGGGGHGGGGGGGGGG